MAPCRWRRSVEPYRWAGRSGDQDVRGSPAHQNGQAPGRHGRDFGLSPLARGHPDAPRARQYRPDRLARFRPANGQGRGRDAPIPARDPALRHRRRSCWGHRGRAAQYDQYRLGKLGRTAEGRRIATWAQHLFGEEADIAMPSASRQSGATRHSDRSARERSKLVAFQGGKSLPTQGPACRLHHVAGGRLAARFDHRSRRRCDQGHVRDTFRYPCRA